MIVVHVIPPDDAEGDRHEEHFPDGTAPAQILKILTEPHMVRNKRVRGRQIGYGLLKDGERYLDNPNTVVAIGEVIDGKFHERQRIKGPNPT